MYLFIDNLKRNKKKKIKEKVISNTYQVKDEHSDTLYLTVNNIQISQYSENEQSSQMPIQQQILSQLKQSIVEKDMLDSQVMKNNQKGSVQSQLVNSQINYSHTQKTKSQNKFGIKFSPNRQKIQTLQSQYLGSLNIQLKCHIHQQYKRVQNSENQFFMCLQQYCNSKRNINRNNNSNEFLQSKNIHSKNTPNNNQSNNLRNSSTENVAKSKASQQRQNIKEKSKFQSRLLCQKCLIQNRHLGHKICTYDKFQQMIYSYHWASTQTSKKLISKIEHLKENIDNYFTLLSNKAIEIMTLGFIKQWQDFKNVFQKYQLHKSHSKLIGSNRQKSSLSSPFHSQVNDKCYTEKQQNLNERSNISIQNPQIGDQIFSASASQIWEQLLSCQTEQSDCLIQKILKYKQQSILEQIEYIDINFKQSIANSITNLQFVNNYKDWVFNPNDMSEDSVGLTLDRNKIQGLKQQISPTPTNYESINSMKSTKLKGRQPKQQNFFAKTNADSNCKIVFTQTPLTNQSVRSFKIEGLHQKILIACVDKQDHNLISNQLGYNHYQKYLYGIQINFQGFITVYNKGETPFKIHHIKLKANDIIEVTLNANNNTITFLKYSQMEQHRNKKNTKQENQEKLKRIVIATLPIQIKQQNQQFCLLAGVASKGDSVSLTQNILIQNKIQSTEIKDFEKSQQTIKYTEQNILQNQNKNVIQGSPQGGNRGSQIL